MSSRKVLRKQSKVVNYKDDLLGNKKDASIGFSYLESEDIDDAETSQVTFVPELEKVADVSEIKTVETDVSKTDGWQTVEKKKIKGKKRDDESGPESNGYNKFLNAPWTVYTHDAVSSNWSEDTYTTIYTIDSIGNFINFFSAFPSIQDPQIQIFIMRNKIKPIWEDNENRNGGICSLRFAHSEFDKVNFGSLIMTTLSLLLLNETLTTNDSELNGISYSIKKGSVLIKLWCKNFKNDVSKKLPRILFDKFNSMMTRFGSYQKDRISLRYSQIKPEYEA